MFYLILIPASIQTFHRCFALVCLCVSSHHEEMDWVLDAGKCHASHDVVASVVGVALPVLLNQVDEVHDGCPHTATQQVGHQRGHAAEEVVQLLQAFPLVDSGA